MIMLPNAPLLRRGFTLVELLLVISIISILGGLGASTYRDYADSRRVSVAADEFASVLATAKSRAISQVKPSSCGSAELDGYRVVACPGGCTTKQTYVLQAYCGNTGWQVGNAYKLPDGVVFSSSLQQVILFRTLTGAVESSGSGVSIQSGSKAKAVSVSVAGVIAMSGLEPLLPVGGAPTLSFNADATSVPWGGYITLTWTSTNTDNCTASGGWVGTKVPSSATGEVVGPLTTATTFTLTCTGSGGTTSPQSKAITVSSPQAPVITDFHAEDPVLSPTNTGTTLHWATSGSVTSCMASNGSGAWSGSQSFPTGDFDTEALTLTKTYTLTCTGPLGSTGPQSIVVTVSSGGPTPTPTSAPSLNFKANSSIPNGSAVNLSWTSLNLSSCSGNSVPGDSSWANHATSLGGSHLTPGLTSTTIYTLNCIGTSGNPISASVTETNIPGTVYTAITSPNTKIADSTAGVKRTILRANSSFTLKGFGLYIESGVGNYTWAVYAPNASTLLASGTTGAIPDTNGYYYANLGSGVAIPVNTTYLYLDLTFPNASSGTTRYVTSWQDMAGTPIAVVNSWFRNAIPTDGGYAIKIIYQ